MFGLVYVHVLMLQSIRVSQRFMLVDIYSEGFNPLRPNSDKHQISPCNINACSTPEVMRIKDMITQGEFS